LNPFFFSGYGFYPYQQGGYKPPRGPNPNPRARETWGPIRIRVKVRGFHNKIRLEVSKVR
jgi:hypothetical protein